MFFEELIEKVVKLKFFQVVFKFVVMFGKLCSWEDEVSKQFCKQVEQGLYYFVEVIVQGLQGEVFVLMIIGGNGQVSVVWIEQSSGYCLFDEVVLYVVCLLCLLLVDVLY